jgi:hypothetical protein
LKGMRPQFAVSRIVLAAACAASAAVIDRIAVSVGDRVITTSDLEREIRVNSFLNGKPPDFSPAARRATAERMVEQKLVRKELENSRYPVPQASDVAPALDDFKKRFYPNSADYQSALAEHGITERDIVDEMLWQRTLLEFIDVRFRPAVQVSDSDVKDYFDRVVAPAARAANPGKPVALEDFIEKIRSTLTGQREDREMDAWLKEARERTDIVYHDEAFK